MMLHQDGSTRAWVPSCQWDLMVPWADATSEIYSAFFVEEEGTLAVFHGLRCLARYHADGRLIETGGAEPGRRTPTHGSGYCPIADPRPTARETISARG